jgi:hypothetical protein
MACPLRSAASKKVVARQIEFFSLAQDHPLRNHLILVCEGIFVGALLQFGAEDVITTWAKPSTFSRFVWAINDRFGFWILDLG